MVMQNRNSLGLSFARLNLSYSVRLTPEAASGFLV